jgi:hypothetical protein
MNESVEANGYEFFFECEKLQPPIGRHHRAITHEVKVIRIYDRKYGNRRVYDDFNGGHIGMGTSEQEAFEKSAAAAKRWADKQPSDRA